MVLVLDYVASVQAKEVVVVCRTRELRHVLKQSRARRELLRPSRWRVRYADDAELATALALLRDAGFAFAGAPGGWPPAAVFEHLRERGPVRGRFTEVVWAGPRKPEYRQL
jgi:hypothetical protein